MTKTSAYLDLDPTGVYVVGVGYSTSPPDDTSMLSPDQNDPYQFAQHHLVNGELIPRPTIPEPTRIDGGWRFTACPVDTQILIFDTIGEELMCDHTITTDGENFDFALPDAGTYCLEVHPPLPHTHLRLFLEVTA